MTDVFVVAPVRVHRQSLAEVLDGSNGIRVVGDAATLREAFDQLRGRAQPPVAVLDGADLSELVLAGALALDHEARVVALGLPTDDALAWIEAGASGVVPPDASLVDLIAALHKVAADELAAPPQVTAHLAKRVRTLSAAYDEPRTGERLTTRESEVLDLLSEGLSNKEIAQRLSIQLQTVKNHVHNVLAKLGVTRRSEAVARMRRQRL
jgi:two-component system nitrate/nitrite response regulator NarL